ncbi:uncharacterized protein LOC134532707 isoform X2 [Bacillus rossius redtenbacheri]|uniref:uncharacterized protein LOC134532707 isoform X2 n=1 Tax=Bacillus rossius redtenbacheri TaxID=93214 RepID=UPI002FDD3099
MDTSRKCSEKIGKAKLTRSLRTWLLSCGGRQNRRRHLEKLRETLVELGNVQTMKKAIFQLSMRCEVSVEKLTQEEINKYSKRNKHHKPKRKLTFVHDGLNKKRKIRSLPHQSACVSKLQNGSGFICHTGNFAHSNVTNGLPAPHLEQDHQNKASLGLAVNEPQELHASQSVPSSVLNIQRNGMTLQSDGTDWNRNCVGINSLSVVSPNPGMDTSRLQDYTDVSSGGTISTEMQKKINMKTLSEKFQITGLEIKPAKAVPTSTNGVHNTWGRSVSLDIKPSYLLKTTEAEINSNNTMSLKPASSGKCENSLSDGSKKSYAVMHAGKMQARSNNILSHPATSNTGATANMSIEDAAVAQLPPGTTLTLQSISAKKVPVTNENSASYPVFDKKSNTYKYSSDRSSSVSKENCNGRVGVSNDHPKNKNFHKNESINNITFHTDKFATEKPKNNRVLLSSDSQTKISDVFIKTEVDLNNPHFVLNVQENSVIRNPSLSNHIPESPQTYLDMPDISDKISSSTSKLVSHVWKRSNSETHKMSKFIPLQRRHSLDQYSDGGQRFLEYPMQLQKDKTIKHPDSTQYHHRQRPNIFRKTHVLERNVNCGSASNKTDCMLSSQTLSKDLPGSASQADCANHIEGKEKHTSVQIQQNSAQYNSNSMMPSQSKNVQVKNEDCEENPEESTCKETKILSVVNSSRSKCLSRRHSSCTSNHSSLKKKLKLLFGESDEDIVLDDNCPSPEKIFRRLSNTNFNMSSPTHEVSKISTSSKPSISENLTLDAGNLVQLDLSGSSIDKLFPSAADNEGGNSDKIQILPHLDDINSNLTTLDAIDTHNGQNHAEQTDSMEIHSESFIQNDVLPIPILTQCITTENSGSSDTSEKTQLHLQSAVSDSLENVILTHSSVNLSEINDAVTTNNDLESSGSAKIQPDDPQSKCDGLLNNSALFDEVSTDNAEFRGFQTQLPSGNDVVTPKIPSENVPHYPQTQKTSEANGWVHCRSGEMLSPVKSAVLEVSIKVLDAAHSDRLSLDVSQVLETNKPGGTGSPLDLDCNNHARPSNSTDPFDGNDASMVSDVQAQQPENNESTIAAPMMEAQLPACSEDNSISNSLNESSSSENVYEIKESAGTLSTEVQSEIVKNMSVCENVATVDSAGPVEQVKPLCCTKDSISETVEVIAPHLPVKQEINCDKIKNNLCEADGGYTTVNDPLPLNSDVEAAKEIVDCPSHHERGNSIGMSSALSVANCLSSNHLKERMEKVNSSVTVTAQNCLNQNVTNSPVMDSQIPQGNLDQEIVARNDAVEAAPVNANVQPGSPKNIVPNDPAPNNCHIGTIRVKDVNSLVEPALARVQQYDFNSKAFEKFTVVVFTILQNRSRFIQRQAEAQMLPEEYSKIEYESALRDYTVTLYGRELMFTDFVLENYGSLTEEICMATLSRIESVYGKKYSYDDFQICLKDLNKLRINRLTQEYKKKCERNSVSGKVDSRPWGVDSTDNSTHSKPIGVHQESGNVSDRVNINYVNHQMPAVEPQPQFRALDQHTNAVGNTSVVKKPLKTYSRASLLGTLLEDSNTQQNSQMQGFSSSSNPVGIQQHTVSLLSNVLQSRTNTVSVVNKTVHNVESTQSSGNLLKTASNVASGKKGSTTTYHNHAQPQHIQQLQNEKSSMDYRRKQQELQVTAYRPTENGTSVITQANRPLGNMHYVNTEIGLATISIGKEATTTPVFNYPANAQLTTRNRYEPSQLISNVTGKNQNRQLASKEAVTNQPRVPNSAYSKNNDMAVSGASSQRVVSKAITCSGNNSQSVYIEQLQSTVNHYTPYIGTSQVYCPPVVQATYKSTDPTAQAYQSTVTHHQASGVLPTYDEVLRTKQFTQNLCSSYTQPFSTNVGQQLQHSTAAPVNHTSEQLNNIHPHLANENLYSTSTVRSSHNLSSSPYQAQNYLQHSNLANNVSQVQSNSFPNVSQMQSNAFPNNISQVQSNTFQQYSSLPSQQYAVSSSQQVNNFRQNVALNTYHLGQVSNRQYTPNISQQTASAAYQLYQRGATAPNVSLVPSGHLQASSLGRPGAAENARQAAYGHPTGAAAQVTADALRQQAAALELQKLLLTSDASKSAQRVARRAQRASLGQQSAQRAAGSNYAVGEHQAVQSGGSSVDHQQYQQHALPGQASYAASSSVGFVPPPEQVAAAADNNLDDVILVYEQRSNEPRTVSRDSGYTTPSPRVATNAVTNVIDAMDCEEGKVVKVEGEMKCVRCGETARELCSACRVASYCSKLCQLTDWESNHYAVCNSLSSVSEKMNVS